MKKIAVLCLALLILSFASPCAFAFNLSANPVSTLTFELVGLETFGSLDLLSDLLAASPESSLGLTIVLNPDGTFYYDYQYVFEDIDQSATFSGTWSATKNSYILTREDSMEYTLLRDAKGYYVLVLDGLNMLLLTDDAIQNGVHSLEGMTALVPENISDFNQAFKGTIDTHREAVEYVCELLNGVSMTWQDDVRLTNELSCAQFTVSDGDQIRIVYNSSTKKVYAYVYGVELSTLDKNSVLVSKIMSSEQMAIPLMSAMWTESEENESVFLENLYSLDWGEQTAVFNALIPKAMENGTETVDYFNLKLTMIKESDGYSHSFWIVLHSAEDHSSEGISSLFGALSLG